MARREQNSRSAVLFVATTFVLCNGIVICLFIVMAFSDDAIFPLLAVLGLLTTTVIFLSLLRTSSGDAMHRRGLWEGLVSWFRRRNMTPSRKKYYPIKKKYLQVEQFGRNQPPTVESIRDQINHLNTFVPADKRETQPDPPTSQLSENS